MTRPTTRSSSFGRRWRALDAEPDTALRTVALFTLIANDEIETAIARCDAIIDAARPRGWLIALAMASHMRAMALMPAGRMRDAELDARLGFDYKLAVAPIHVVLFALQALVDALVELDELDEAEAALAAAGQRGIPRLAPRARRSRSKAAHDYGSPSAGTRTRTPTRAPPPRDGTSSAWAIPASPWRVDAADALVALGDSRRAPARRRAPHLADRVGLPRPSGAGLRALARTASPAERIALLEHAAALLAETPCQLEHTRALVDLGAALRRANRRADARRAASSRA